MRSRRPAGRRRPLIHVVLAAAAAALVLVAAPSLAVTRSTTKKTPNLMAGSAYLVTPANLVNGHYYSPYGGGYADWGLTIDGAFALAATRDENSTLAGIVTYIEKAGDDGADTNINTWTGVGTPYVSGGDLGKEALLAEVVGVNPRDFGRLNLISQIDAAVCTAASTDGSGKCVAAGNYYYSSSVFDQALGIMAQMRAGDTANARSPVTYLLSLQHTDGSFPSLIPPVPPDSDVDSTAMAAMALALVPSERAAVAKAVAWIAEQQESNGGFPGTSGDSTNTTGLAIQALDLETGTYTSQVAAAEAFLAGQQNSDGGFNVAAGQAGSDVRASTQALGGSVGTSFGTLSIDLSGVSPPKPKPTPSATRTTPKPSVSKSTAKSGSGGSGSASSGGGSGSGSSGNDQALGSVPRQTPTPTPSPTPSPSPVGQTTTPATVPGITATSPTTTPTRTAKVRAVTAAASESLNPWWWVTIGVAIALALAVGTLFARRYRVAAHVKRGGS
jgi:hypothetical protein